MSDPAVSSDKNSSSGNLPEAKEKEVPASLASRGKENPNYGATETAETKDFETPGKVSMEDKSSAKLSDQKKQTVPEIIEDKGAEDEIKAADVESKRAASEKQNRSIGAIEQSDDVARNTEPMDTWSKKEDAPPSYAPSAPKSAPNYEARSSKSVPRLSKQDFKSGRKKATAAKCANWCLGSSMMTVCIVVFYIVPLACVVIGAIGFNDCPVESMIPIWLIVFGIAVLIFLFVLLVLQICGRRRSKKLDAKNRLQGRRTTETELYEAKPGVSLCALVFIVLILLFLLAWFIVGNVYVFENWHAIEEDPLACDELTYYFAFSVIVLVYILTLIMCCICCIIICTAVTVDETKYEGYH